MKRKNQWRIYDIYTGKSKGFNPKIQGFSGFRFVNLLKSGLTVLISVLVIYTIVQAGSLTPTASPASTMHTLQELWDKIAGSGDTTSISADGSGDVIERLEFIQQNLPGGYTYGSSNAGHVLTTAGGNYNATYLIPSNVAYGVSFGVDQTGTFACDEGVTWQYGSNDPANVLTIADANAGTASFNAENLSVGVVKSGVQFGVGPISGTLLPSGGDATTAQVSSGATFYGASQANWTLQNGELSIDASKMLDTATYCGVTGTFDPWTPQKYVRYDDWYNSGGTTNEYTGEEASWTQVKDDSAVGDTIQDGGDATCTDVTDANEKDCARLVSKHVYRDERTGLKWTDRTNKDLDNEFKWVVGEDAETTTAACNFLASGDPNSYCDNYDPSGSYVEDDDLSAADFCLKLSLDDGSGVKTDWRLPSQKELMQAYIDGSANNLPSPGNSFWSSTERSGTSGSAWNVFLSSGTTYTNTKGTDSYVCCVRR